MPGATEWGFSGRSSYLYHSTLTDWSRDRARNNELIALGWRVLSITTHQIQSNPAGVVSQIARALHADDVRNPSVDWRG
jgi:very-short-patch-repair endonuclease